MNIQGVFHHFSQISKLESILALLQWDREVTMPANAVDMRHQQIEVLTSHIHTLTTDAEFLKAVIALSENIKDIPSHQIRNIKRYVLRKASIDSDLQKTITSLELRAFEKWREAKEKNDFFIIEKDFQELIDLRCKAADQLKASPYFSDHKNKSRYDLMIDGSEPGLTNQDLKSIFIPLKDGLKQLLKTTEYRPQVSSQSKFTNFSIKDLIQKFGFDTERGRIDIISGHPFCSGSQDDVRLTTGSSEDAYDNLLTTLHEMGHGLYEQNLPRELQFTPSGGAASTGFHESQSRFYENQIGRSKGFIQYLSTETKLSPDEIQRNLRARTQTPIRVQADEVAYNLHVILRWEAEQALVDGTLKAKDIPEFWNKKMKEDLNIEVKNNQEGCLQDLHWFMGDFGWFPTYALGNVIAAQLYSNFKKEHPDADTRIAGGDFLFIKEFLSRLHSQAATKDFKSLTANLFGKEDLSAEPLLQYLKERY